MVTTIQLNEDVKQKLDKLKIHHRETYNDLVCRLIIEPSSRNANRESLIETIEVLSNPQTMRDIAEALEDINNKDKWVSWKEIKKENEL
ncbi:MAG: hypothetical protein Q8O84_05050 [Nanoarchaeota archaeon]|nr:hypothetical protein [Nanoarchaeota archaeon]